MVSTVKLGTGQFGYEVAVGWESLPCRNRVAGSGRRHN